MKQDTTTEELKSQVDKKPDPKLASLSDLLLWFVTSFALLLASFVSLLYLFLKERGSRPSSRQRGILSLEPRQAENKASEVVSFEHDIIKKDEPVFVPSGENIEQTEQKGNPFTKWFESLSTRSLTPDQIKKVTSSVAGPFLALMLAYIAQGIFDSTIGGGIFRNSRG